MNKYLYFFFFVLLFSSCQEDFIKANLIIRNAKIWTGNSDQPNAEAMAIKGDSILAIGSFKDIKIFRGQNTKTIDLHGNFITPGFIDSHVHLLMGGNSLLNVQLRDANTKEEFIQRIATFSKDLKPNQN